MILHDFPLGTMNLTKSIPSVYTSSQFYSSLPLKEERSKAKEKLRIKEKDQISLQCGSEDGQKAVGSQSHNKGHGAWATAYHPQAHQHQRGKDEAHLPVPFSSCTTNFFCTPPSQNPLWECCVVAFHCHVSYISIISCQGVPIWGCLYKLHFFL